MYRVDLSNRAEKDTETCRRAGYGEQLAQIMAIVEVDPYRQTRHFERLTGDLKGLFSRQISYKNRFVYSVLPNAENAMDENGDLYDGIVRVHESWGHKYKKPPP